MFFPSSPFSVCLSICISIQFFVTSIPVQQQPYSRFTQTVQAESLHRFAAAFRKSRFECLSDRLKPKAAGHAGSHHAAHKGWKEDLLLSQTAGEANIQEHSVLVFCIQMDEEKTESEQQE